LSACSKGGDIKQGLGKGLYKWTFRNLVTQSTTGSCVNVYIWKGKVTCLFQFAWSTGLSSGPRTLPASVVNQPHHNDAVHVMELAEESISCFIQSLFPKILHAECGGHGRKQ
jgi:hypothetical protein